MKRILMILALVIFLSPAAVLAAESTPSAIPADMVAKLREIHQTYFQWRIATLTYNSKALHQRIGEKLMATEDADMPEGSMRVLRDYVRSLRPASNEEVNAWFSTRLPELVKGIYHRLANNFALKLESLNGELALDIFAAVEKDDATALAAMLRYLKAQRGYGSTAYIGTLFVLETKLAFEARYAEGARQTRLAELAREIKTLHNTFSKVKTYDADKKVLNSIGKMDNKRLWRWLAKAILVETQDTPSRLEWQHMIDINKATVQDLMNIPGVAAATAQKIVAYRSQHGTITSINELNRIKGLGLKTLRRIKTVCYVGEFRYPVKDTTVLCFFNGDNDLELSSMLGINTFEKVGTTDKLNIVVQVDRIGQKKLAEGGQGDSDSWLDGNWTSARRYLIMKDNIPFQLGSVLMEKMGEVDMGSEESLVDFVRWGVAHFPARRYVLVICNHGSEFGIGGISFDEENDNHFDTLELGKSLASVNKVFKQSNGEEKFASMIFDCCLLANVETMSEIRDSVHSAFACENVQITWYDYDKFFQYLHDNPKCTPQEIARAFLVAYTRSMAGGTMVLNATAFDLDRFDSFFAPFKDFAAELSAYADRAPDKVKEALSVLTPIKETTVFDLRHFAGALAAKAKGDERMQATARGLVDSWGEPGGSPAGFVAKHYPPGHFIISEAHNNLEPTAHGLAIHFNDPITWAAIAREHPQGKVMTPEWINKWTSSWFQRFPYQKLRVARETEWDEFLEKTLKF